MSIDTPVGVEDVAPVKSRISWGPIIAGSVVALAVYFMLTLLGGAIGLSVNSQTINQPSALLAAGVAIAVTALCLFLGGLVASQLSVGENKLEGALYGILVWGVVFAALLWLMASGVKAGFSTMVGVATAGAAVNANSTDDWEGNVRKIGFTQEQIDEVKKKTQDAAAQAKAAAEDPATLKKVSDNAMTVAWLSFAGCLVSLLAAVAGGRIGAGPTFHLFRVTPAHTVPRRLRVELP